MGALPKRRISSSRQGHRRSHHRVALPHLVACPQCGELRVSHHVCANCGTYRGVTVIVKKERAPRAEQ
jgi:large subunit ribosomal protein L32